MSEFIKTFATYDAADGTYTLTTAGLITATVLAVILFILAIALANKSKHITARELTFSAIALALGYITSGIKLLHMPLGGSVTLFSMLFIALIGYWFGLRIGLMCAFAMGLLQLLQGAYIISFPQMIIDYVLAFGALSLSGIFKEKKHGLILGYIAAVLGRYFFTVLSGVVFFGMYVPDTFPVQNALIYSLVYNGIYLGAEAAITVVILMIPAVAKALDSVKRMAVA